MKARQRQAKIMCNGICWKQEKILKRTDDDDDDDELKTGQQQKK
jgi:hypothetical protein